MSVICRGCLITPGYSIIVRTRMPPSYKLPLFPNKPPVEPTGNAPLSLVYHSAVFYSTFISRRAVRRLPTARSMPVISPRKSRVLAG